MFFFPRTKVFQHRLISPINGAAPNDPTPVRDSLSPSATRHVSPALLNAWVFPAGRRRWDDRQRFKVTVAMIFSVQRFLNSKQKASPLSFRCFDSLNRSSFVGHFTAQKVKKQQNLSILQEKESRMVSVCLGDRLWSMYISG